MYSVRDVAKAVIPVGGLGTRLLPATKALPKELLPVGRRPAVQYVVEEMRAAGLESMCFVAGRKQTLIQEHFDSDPELVRHLQDLGRDELLAELAYVESGLHLTYIRQSGPLGVADALSLVEDYVGNRPFVVALGDSLVFELQPGTLIERMIRAHVEKEAEVTIAVDSVSVARARTSIIAQPASGTPAQATAFDVAELTSAPGQQEEGSHWAVAARFVFSPTIFPAIQRARPGKSGELQLTEVLRIMLRQGAKLQAVCLLPGQRRYDIGNFGGYFRAFLELALNDRRYGSELRGYLEDWMARTQAMERKE